MKVEIDKIHEEFDRFIYWTKISFLSDDNSKQSHVIAGASYEYIDDLYKLQNRNQLTDKHLTDWIEKVRNKWMELGDSIFKQKTHFDVYANTSEGESNITDFLLNRVGRQ